MVNSMKVMLKHSVISRQVCFRRRHNFFIWFRIKTLFFKRHGRI